LKQLREGKGLSQKELAKKIDVALRHYQGIEYGETNPGIDIVLALANYFDVSLDYLVGRNFSNAPSNLPDVRSYQVFVSSTFADLRPEREAVQKSLRKAGYFVTGMEDFAASPGTAWDLITSFIEQSDYYLLVVAARYGSICPGSKLSYTEKEYRYAIERQKPCVAMLHESPGDIPNRLSDEGRQKKLLANFRKFVADNGSTVGYWKDAESLALESLAALRNAERRHPAVGWIRADSTVAEASAQSQMLGRIESLERQTRDGGVDIVVGSERITL
jgi:transcriptional regulator with XRE-family HTH domain